MIRLDSCDYGQIYDLYRTENFFFPLIGSVLLGEQDGVVSVNCRPNPTQVYVEHAFGFAQVFGTTDLGFEERLRTYLLFERNFSPSKIRLYAAYLPAFLDTSELEPLRSVRQRFRVTPEDFADRVEDNETISPDVVLVNADLDNVSKAEEVFGVVSRFWRTPLDFVQHSHAVIALHDGDFAAICYSAANADGCAEIDVMTLPQFRKHGLAKLVCREFIQNCFRKSLQPMWDCFTNNAGSMMLCASLGYTSAFGPYPFFTINKQVQ